MKYLHRIFSPLLRGKQRGTLFHLRNLSERQLLDCGISPYLVSKGLKGWPWRIEHATSELSTQENFNVGERQYVADTRGNSDSNTALPGLSRSIAANSTQKARSEIKHNESVKAA